MGKKSKHKKARNKHDRLCEELSDRIADYGSYNTIETNVEYELGELDVYAINCGRQVYYEVKGNHSDKALEKAHDQLQRWTEYMHKRYKDYNFYGVYYTPQKIKLLYKNGYKR